eukprot:CAMPEP_0170555928 /NCGR_PEP_ID=MMETSP0211-20121228/14716_1 /TAXON_ID=311385 /ORGANISM="Pseudokeronopsis sp., Strain OXSARD2" /LENGTH=99 /DNA_ID=CAMNT_0010865963 /DNA_START=523 /DNA_END=822 /DNA_ORIENTATION=-
MNAEDLSLYNSANAEVVEDLRAVLPGVRIPILSDSLIIEPVDSSDLPGLMVPSQQCDIGWVLEFEAEEELEGLDGVVASVHEVSHEDVPRVGDVTTLIK